MISHFAVNWLAVILATLASWLFGAGWYMALAKQWTASIGKKPEDINKSDYMPYIWSVLCLFVMAYFIALLTPLLTGDISVANGVLIGAHMWLGFVITAMVLNHRYEGALWARTLIDGGYLLAVLLIDGVVIGLFG
ncbi:DUF1761 domain-containing protein [Devosia sp. RR2S18]|uniref:DUF1761 domain-containing protein n=1 Tax=Devosia rhizosphaerae TaxID=3049774 RepID=UPI0025415FAD|nr:DUF1761 domain-containing protein [Devosia sp. RR2S18]WIJ25514.1 DUF1761 domain-containing protein [Devosia sp. RR2S18]